MLYQPREGLSIVVPMLNERGNLRLLLARISKTLQGRIPYEVIVVDDHSTDGSWELLLLLMAHYPVSAFRKRGAKGKAESLREGFAKAQYDSIAFIDADLQYPPEALWPMYQGLAQADMVVTQRVKWINVSPLRRISSRLFNFFTARLLFGLDFDVQSGLKMFRRTLLPLALAPSERWSFDIPFLWHATRLGKRIVSYPITFSSRSAGTSKIRFLGAGTSLIMAAIRLRLRGTPTLPIQEPRLPGQAGHGVIYKDKEFITHTSLPIWQSAIYTLSGMQKVILAGLVVILAVGFWQSWSVVLQIVVLCLTVLYLLDLIFTFVLTVRSFISAPEFKITDQAVASLVDDELPVYSILCPLYKEEAVLEQFVTALTQLDWPKDVLDVQLLLEEDDRSTIAKARSLDLPDWIRLMIVPRTGEPRTKPKACNWGLAHAMGDYVVIYDAEDIPEPDQLKKVYLAFQQVPAKVICIQAKLAFYNAGQNLLTRLFAAEYHLWFGLILPGLQSLNGLIPLGGTSNHFRRQALEDIHAWDAFNVTEDCDLGIRLFREGWQTAIIDSVTYEEANSRMFNWLRQRSRWIKGYLQSYLVAMRRPFELTHNGHTKLLYFHMTVGAKVFSLFLNPLFWFLTIGYVVARPVFGPFIEVIYPSPLLYIGSISLIAGNFLYFYSHMLAVAKKKEWWLVKYTLFIPVYWLLMSVASWYALWQLITRPHYWEKTVHGLHINKQASVMPLKETALVNQEV